MYVTSCDLAEFEVSSDVGGDEDVGELSVRHEQLGYEINVPVIGSSVLLPWLSTFGIVAIFLE